MKFNQSLLIAALSLFAASGLFAKHAAKKNEVPGIAPQPTEFFYTGKPYDADLEAYTFNYRNYDPAISRWTSADLLGFPNGENNHIYVKNPLVTYDPDGCAWSDLDFVYHYYFGGGKTVALSDIGLLSSVKGVADSNPSGGAYRFSRQVDNKVTSQSMPYNGDITDSFSNSYNFSSVCYSMGAGTLKGKYDGAVTSSANSSGNGGTYSYTGTAGIYYTDTFCDPLSVIQYLYGSSSSQNAPAWLALAASVGGTPYSVIGLWSETFSGSGTYE